MAWRARFKMKDLLTREDVVPAEAIRLGGLVAKRLRRAPFDTSTRTELGTLFEDVLDQDDFNAAMDELYDVADADRVWVC